jgi:outer membrane cobalamin receptor
VRVEIRNGDRARLEVTLAARPIELAEVRAEATRPGTDVLSVPRSEIVERGARTAADALAGRAGLVIRRHGPGGPQTLSIRGSSADQVLVLLDGSPLNDPSSGEADLSAIPAAEIESITVLRGGRSARYGPRAEAGVVLIESRSGPRPLTVRADAGSLGSRSLEAEIGGPEAGFRWTGGFHTRNADGRFQYRPLASGGRLQARENADLSERSALLTATGSVADGELRLRGGYTTLDRGLPGLGFLPSQHARQSLDRWRGAVRWDRVAARTQLSVSAHALRQTTAYSDPAPPAGLPYDDRAVARTLGLRAEGVFQPASAEGVLRSASAGVEIRNQRYGSTALSGDAPAGRTDAGLFGTIALRPARDPIAPDLTAALRLDRDGTRGVWRLTHEVGVRAGLGALEIHARRASSYSPPTFGDQFFREGVAVRPNPDLRAERIPAEYDLGASASGGGAVIWRVAADAYLADVEDMIVWSPDYRFVWSPRNIDVRRSGLDIDATLNLPSAVEVRGQYSLSRVTYDRPGDVQVIYRPRHTGGVTLSWRPDEWRLNAEARYTGVRYPVPAKINALDPFWTLDLRVQRDLRIAGWRVTPSLDVDRLFDNTDALIFGYPEPGRTFRLSLGLQPQ